MLKRGNQLHNMGWLDGAEKVFKEGQQFAPDDYQFPLNLARIAVDRNQDEQVAALLEQVLTMAPDDQQAYILSIDCWAVAGNLDEVRKVLERARQNLTLTPAFYITIVKLLLTYSASPFGSPLAAIFGYQQSMKPPDERWQELAMEIMNQATESNPDDPEIRLMFAAELLRTNPKIALQQAEEATRLAPENPRMLHMLGMLQGLNEQLREAKATLRNAAKLARKQGDKQLADDCDMLRQQIDKPHFREIMHMGMLDAIFGEGDDDFDDEDLDDLDFFF
jgi:tetratricopeptide (TPR) repeat protein